MTQRKKEMKSRVRYVSEAGSAFFIDSLNLMLQSKRSPNQKTMIFYEYDW